MVCCGSGVAVGVGDGEAVGDDRGVGVGCTCAEMPEKDAIRRERMIAGLNNISGIVYRKSGLIKKSGCFFYRSHSIDEVGIHREDTKFLLMCAERG